MDVRHAGVVLAQKRHRIDAADRRMARVERHEHQLGIGHLQNHVDLGLPLDDGPGMRMERELDAMLERALADLVQILREDLAVRDC